MKILFNTSPGAFKNAGGGEIQMLKTKEHLEKKGLHVEIFEQMQNKKISGFNIFHNFNIHRDCFETVMSAKNAKIPIAISPIYWPSWKFDLKGDLNPAAKIKAFAVHAINKFDFAGVSKVKKMLHAADVLLPNSKSEAEMLVKMFAVERKKIKVVHNGVEERFRRASPELFRKKYGVDEFVLYVGRIEPRKNVLGLVKAVQGTDLQLVIIGSGHSLHADYFRACKSEAGANVKFVGELPHESEILASAYAAAKVFALPSWYETPGIAALEAALAGANIVITQEGCTKEYFEEFVSYVNPADVAEIREKIIYEFEKPRSGKLQNHVGKNFLLENTANETLEAYEGITGSD